jgi:putative transposase
MNIRKICSVFGYSRQAYYKSLLRQADPDNNNLVEYLTSRRKELPFEGIRKVYTHLLKDTEYNVSRTSLELLMLEKGLITRQKRKYRSLTDSLHGRPYSKNYLMRNKPEQVFEVLVSDITYLKTSERECYLTAIMDLYSRLILSYCLTARLTNEGLIRAFKLIADNYGEFLEGCIFHSDRGSQFCSRDFIEITQEYGVILSNSRNGNPYDNACMERFFATLKNEFMLKIIYTDMYSLNKALSQAVRIYNMKRLHMSLNNQTPKEKFIESLRSYEHINKERKSSKKKENVIIN